jgi:hypothetical protein
VTVLRMTSVCARARSRRKGYAAKISEHLSCRWVRRYVSLIQGPQFSRTTSKKPSRYSLVLEFWVAPDKAKKTKDLKSLIAKRSYKKNL